VSKKDSIDQVSYHVVIRGIDGDAFELAATHFNCRRGGVNPSDHSVYISIPLELASVEAGVSWINDSLGGMYQSLVVGVSVHTERNWSNFMVPSELISVIAKYDVQLKINFSSPVHQ
jgi:hypothetical protein